ncbi:MAG: PEP-CTERM sorting domain-containing protein [Chthonomonas sp.]|nr:PEP-CTERM sorting domain-containing protein [Chthonomonas sp.]
MKRNFSLVMLGAFCLVAASQAESLKFTGTDLDNPHTVSIRVNGSNAVSVKAGRLVFTDGSRTFATYCADALRFLNYSWNNYSSSTVDTTGLDGLAKAGRIVGAHFNDANTANQQAGLQLAVWSALYDNGAAFNANGTNFKVTGANSQSLSLAEMYYQSASQQLPPTTLVRHYAGQGNHAQNQLTVECVPEPVSMAALGLGLAGMIRRRRSAK